MKEIEIQCKIVEKGENEKEKFVILEGNPFYPDGKGGQIGDRGSVGNASVLFTEESEKGVLVYVDKFKEAERGSYAECKIDPVKKHTISALHTVQHILSAVLEDRFYTRTVAFHMSEDACTIDVSSASISDSVLNEVENLANEIVFSNLNGDLSINGNADIINGGGLAILVNRDINRSSGNATLDGLFYATGSLEFGEG